MDRTLMRNGYTVSPDAIRIGEWGYDVDLHDGNCDVFSYDWEKIWREEGDMHRCFGGKKVLDFRYFRDQGLLTVWIADGGEIVKGLKDFEEAYRNGDWKPFDIDTVKLIFVSNGYAVRCGFNELDEVDCVDENFMIRGYHMLNWLEKRSLMNAGWRRRYFKEGDRAWFERHGKVDVACWHLLAYEE